MNPPDRACEELHVRGRAGSNEMTKMFDVRPGDPLVGPNLEQLGLTANRTVANRPECFFTGDWGGYQAG